MRHALALLTVLALAGTGAIGAATAAETEALGPFMKTESDKTTLIMMVCARQPGLLDCQFAATQIGKSATSGCYIAMNSYPVSLKASGDGRWSGTKVVPQCPTGRTDYNVELDDKNKPVSGARLIISGCHGTPPEVFAYDTKGISWTPNCAAFTTMGHPATIDRIRKSK